MDTSNIPPEVLEIIQREEARKVVADAQREASNARSQAEDAEYSLGKLKRSMR